MGIDNLVSGLVGALIGSGVTVVAQWFEHRHQGRIAARAVHAELAANTADMRLILRTGKSMQPVTSTAWDLRVADVARVLGAKDFYRVAEAYALLPYCKEIRDRVVARGNGTLKDDERTDLERMVPDLSAANDVLRRAAWRRGAGPKLEDLRR